MLLSKEAINSAVDGGAIAISPFDPSLLKEASYTFTVGTHAYRLENPTLAIDFRFAPPTRKEVPLTEEGIAIAPGDFVLFETREHLKLSPGIACILSVRGHLGLSGLDLLGSDFFCEPDTDNHITLGVSNRGPFPVRIYKDMPVVKGIFISTGNSLS